MIETMDLSNIKRSVLIIASSLIVLVIILISVFVVMIKHNNIAVTPPLTVRKNPTVTFTSGESELLYPGDETWRELEIGDVIREGGSVRTGEDGVIDIRFSDGTALRIVENSFLAVDDVSLKRIELDVKKGRMISKFTKLYSDQDFQIKTESMVAGIRGTELIVDASEENTEIWGMSGITEIYNPDYPDSKVLLGFQTKTVINENSIPANPKPMTQEEVSKFRNMLDSINTEMVLVIGNAIQFEPDTAKITADSLKDLESFAKKIRWKSYTVEIRGHTADIGDAGSQYSLSLQRAETIRDYLVSQKIKSKRLLVRGYGGAKPIAPNNTTEGRKLNRRVEFVIVE